MSSFWWESNGVTLITLLVVLPQLFWVWRLFARLRGRAREQQRLMVTGPRAPARILAVQPTGTTVNDQPEVHVWLHVFPPGGQPYQARLTRLVSLFDLHRYQAGAAIEVAFDPADPSKVAIAPPAVMMAPSAAWGA
jgi:hypothetical protein